MLANMIRDASSPAISAGKDSVLLRYPSRNWDEVKIPPQSPRTPNAIIQILFLKVREEAFRAGRWSLHHSEQKRSPRGSGIFQRLLGTKLLECRAMEGRHQIPLRSGRALGIC